MLVKSYRCELGTIWSIVELPNHLANKVPLAQHPQYIISCKLNTYLPTYPLTGDPRLLTYRFISGSSTYKSIWISDTFQYPEPDELQEPEEVDLIDSTSPEEEEEDLDMPSTSQSKKSKLWFI